MRKLMWSCAALVALVAGGSFLASVQASRHPDSFWGKCVSGVCTTAARSAPIGWFRSETISPDQHAQKDCSTDARDIGQPLVPAGELVLNRLPGVIVVGDEDVAVSMLPVPPVQTIPVELPGNVQEAEEYFSFMPRCIEDEKVPSFMPSAGDSGGSSNCQEDPHYADQYPGCPHLGSRPIDSPPSPAHPGKATKPGIEDGGVIPASAPPDDHMPQIDESSLQSPEPPLVPDVDSMEFRPSDARPDDFMPKPF